MKAEVKRQLKVMVDGKVQVATPGSVIDVSDWHERVIRAHVKRGMISIVPTQEDVNKASKATAIKASGTKTSGKNSGKGK